MPSNPRTRILLGNRVESALNCSSARSNLCLPEENDTKTPSTCRDLRGRRCKASASVRMREGRTGRAPPGKAARECPIVRCQATLCSMHAKCCQKNVVQCCCACWSASCNSIPALVSTPASGIACNLPTLCVKDKGVPHAFRGSCTRHKSAPRPKTLHSMSETYRERSGTAHL